MRVTILGSGTSFGLPQIGCDCRVCTSEDLLDSRTRAAALVEDNETRLLIDTPPELRIQLLRARVGTIDAVLYTHDHADHVHGIDDLRSFSNRQGTIPVYGLPDTLDRLALRFNYIFDSRVIPEWGTTKPELSGIPLEPGQPVKIGSLDVIPLELDHGKAVVLGYRIGGFAYLTDVKTVSNEVLDMLGDLEVLVVSALLDRSHPTHFSIDEAVEFAQKVGSKRTFLTHLTHRYTHAEFLERLPDRIEPAYDGLTIVF